MRTIDKVHEADAVQGALQIPTKPTVSFVTYLSAASSFYLSAEIRRMPYSGEIVRSLGQTERSGRPKSHLVKRQ